LKNPLEMDYTKTNFEIEVQPLYFWILH
jgi:hypothetical protein